MGGGIGGLLNLNQNGQDYSYLYDGKGNVMVVIDGNQQPVASYRYDVFGMPLKKVATLDQPFRFSTKQYDEQTGLSYYGYRFYNPAVGRWMTRDPLGEAGGINLYGFVGNDPVNAIDPLGLFGAGGPGSIFPGHGDFPGSDYFDYNLEDTGPTAPVPFIGDPERHFRDLPVSERDVANAIASCDKEAFERAAHRGQDYFSHYSKGYRWNPGSWNRALGLGHMFPLINPTAPDRDKEAWGKAAKWTQSRLDKWNKKCGCKQ